MESQGFSQTPQDIMEEYNGCSVPQYTAYRRDWPIMCGNTEDNILGNETRSTYESNGRSGGG